MIRSRVVGDFSEYDTDLHTFMSEVVLPDCPPPLFAIGHSMGGAVLIRAAFRGLRWFDRIVLSAPMIKLAHLPMFGYAQRVAMMLRLSGLGSAYIPGGDASVLAMQPFAGNPTTSDPVRYARIAAVLEAEPALGIGAPTIGWAHAAFKAMASFAQPSYAANIRQPILIVGAGRDQLVSTPAVEEFGVHLRAGSHLVIAGSMHEILMEQQNYRMQFWAACDAFIPGTPLFG